MAARSVGRAHLLGIGCGWCWSWSLDCSGCTASPVTTRAWGPAAAAPRGVVHVVDHGTSEIDLTAPAADPVSSEPVTSNPVASTQVHGPGAHDGTDMAGLCIAVLAGVLLLVVRRWRPAGKYSGRRDLSRLIARPRALPLCRPPDLVAGLCVSRA